MKKILVIILSLLLTLSLFAFTGCAPENEGPVYSETFVYDAENHWKPLLEGSSEDPEYIEFGAHKNKKGKCDCGYYFKCTALYYALNSAGTGLICYGGADPNAPYDSEGEISVSSYDYGNWLHVEIPAEEVYNGKTYPVLELASYSFAFEQIESIKLHEGLKTIGSYSFMKTTKLKEVIIPNSVEHNAKYGYFFNGSLGIERVVFGNGITFIPSYCFYDCRNLKNVTLGNAVTSIGISAFGGCEKLEYIVFPETLSFLPTVALR